MFVETNCSSFHGGSMHLSVPASAPASFELLPRIGHGDAEALALFYDRWEAPVHGFVSRLIRGPEARERVVEAVFWAVWEHAASYEGSSAPIDQWLHALSIACCRAELAARRARNHIAEDRDPRVAADRWVAGKPLRAAVPA
jgi:RNA polymerase sigma-70 factor (ECF subfamily)